MCFKQPRHFGYTICGIIKAAKQEHIYSVIQHLLFKQMKNVQSHCGTQNSSQNQVLNGLFLNPYLLRISEAISSIFQKMSKQ